MKWLASRTREEGDPPDFYWEGRRLLGEPGYAPRAAEVAEQLRGEDGVRAACDVLEATFLRSVAPC